MTLNRWDPLRDLLNFQEKMSRLLDVCGEEGTCKRAASWCPTVDILETPDGYLFRAELPGVGRENINIEVRGNRLVLSGERPIESEPRITAYRRMERVHGFFERSFQLPGKVDVEKAEARYVDGILEVFLPKSQEDHNRSVNVVYLR
ncbi:MAG: Hsp20/alpha crystallin family protein [Desulfomonilaceae bacterium]